MTPTTPPSLVIIADDLTGAADCAARCSAAGLPAVIEIGAPRLPLPSGALAFSSDSRMLPPDEAAARVAALLHGLSGLPGVYWYKKIDSTLRGNLGAELEAVLTTLGRSHALVAPAFPAQQRGLRDGLLCGEQITQSIDLPGLLREQCAAPVALIGLDQVRAGAPGLASALSKAARIARLLVADALTDEDLAALVAAATDVLPAALLCGSAGLIGVLAGALAPPGIAQPPLSPPLSNGPALLVIGSGSVRAHAQIAALCERGKVLLATPDSLEAASGIEALSSGRSDADILLHLPAPTPDLPLDGPLARAQAVRLAETALRLIERIEPELLVLSGGDTATTVLAALGIERLSVLRELLPGMPLTLAVDSARRSRCIILKAGNHGESTALVTLLNLAHADGG